MEIRIKTAEEFRDEHVTVTVKAADNDEAMRVVAALVGGTPAEGYDPTPAIDTLAGNYQRARARITELEADISRRVENTERTEDALIAANAKLIQAESEATRLSRQIEELRDRATHRPSLLAQAISTDQAKKLIDRITALAFNGDNLDVVFTKPDSVPDDYASLLFERLLEIRALLTSWRVNNRPTAGYLQGAADQA